jgi:hypothetical protein
MAALGRHLPVASTAVVGRWIGVGNGEAVPSVRTRVRFSRDGLSSQLFPPREWRAKRWASCIVNSPGSPRKAFGHC